MLQQTRVEAVIPYYERFLARFPNPGQLAAAPAREVLRLWSGLGYYRRARQLHAAARAIARRHAGRFPLELEALRALPGVGEYTAGAVLSIAAGRPLPAVDGNAIRVLGRLRGAPAAPAVLRQEALRLISRRRPGEFNQAIMDLGAMVCRPLRPACPQCPLRRLCRSYPWQPAAATAKKGVIRAQRLELDYALWRKGGRIRLARRPENAAWMPGLWELPAAPEGSGWPVLAEARHSITRYQIRARLLAAPASEPPPRGRWQAESQLDALPLTGLTRKLLRAFAFRYPENFSCLVPRTS